MNATQSLSMKHALLFLIGLLACSDYESVAAVETISQASSACDAAIIFDDADGAPSNVRTTRAAQSPLDNSVVGATALGFSSAGSGGSCALSAPILKLVPKEVARAELDAAAIRRQNAIADAAEKAKFGR